MLDWTIWLAVLGFIVSLAALLHNLHEGRKACRINAEDTFWRWLMLRFRQSSKHRSIAIFLAGLVVGSAGVVSLALTRGDDNKGEVVVEPVFIPLPNPIPDGKVRMAVLPFVNRSGKTLLVEETVYTVDNRPGEEPRTRKVDKYSFDAMSRTESIMSRQTNDVFLLVDRRMRDAAFDEIEFSQSGLVSEETRLRLGRMLGANVQCSGTIQSLTNEQMKVPFTSDRWTIKGQASVEVSVTDVESGAVIARRIFTGEAVRTTRDPDASFDLSASALEQALASIAEDEDFLQRIIPDKATIAIEPALQGDQPSTDPTYRVFINDDRLLGPPFEVEGAAGALLKVRVEHDGYANHAETLKLTRDGVITPTLAPEGP